MAATDDPRVVLRRACVRLVYGGHSAVAGDQMGRIEPGLDLPESRNGVAETVVDDALGL